jgi:group II intron reverse transcriptase/maturase
MNGGGKSDGPVVPEKRPNKGPAAVGSAEDVEGRGAAKGNSGEGDRIRAQKRAVLQQALERVREVAKTRKEERFTTLWHHVYNVDRLREAYFRLQRDSAAGIDGETWRRYGETLEENLADLSGRLQRGGYQAKPVRRVYIPKSDGRQRPIGVPVLEDKVVQRSAVDVLEAVYENDFMGFSYGFRPGRSQHHALDALYVGITTKKVNWVLDADIRGFFDAIDHEWLVKFIEHRIADERVIRHVKKWLKAGVFEGGKTRATEQGTPQGGSISPLLANIYLHYVFDLWAHQWRARQASGDIVFVRYADDFIVGFQHREDAERFLADLRERFRGFALDLHPDKTRLIEFGRHAAERRKERGDRRPETFDFLGFTHICEDSRIGRFRVRRKSARKKLSAKLKQLRADIRRRMHWKISRMGAWLHAVVTGHFNYYGVPLNYGSLATFRHAVIGLWYHALRRRSQRTRMTWPRMWTIADSWLPAPHITHPFPDQRFRVRTQGRSPVR